jgi:hypothetical protein
MARLRRASGDRGGLEGLVDALNFALVKEEGAAGDRRCGDVLRWVVVGAVVLRNKSSQGVRGCARRK